MRLAPVDCQTPPRPLPKERFMGVLCALSVWMVVAVLFQGSAGWSDTHQVAILPPENLTRQVEYDWIGPGIADYLVSDIVQNNKHQVVALPPPPPQSVGLQHSIPEALGVIPSSRIVPSLQPVAPSMSSTEQIIKQALNQGATRVVMGSYQVAGGQIRVIFNLLPVTSTVPLSSFQETGSIEALFDLQDKLGVLLHRHLAGETQPVSAELPATPTPEPPPSDPEPMEQPSDTDSGEQPEVSDPPEAPLPETESEPRPEPTPAEADPVLLTPTFSPVPALPQAPPASVNHPEAIEAAREAMRLRNAKRFDEAIRAYRRALQIQPDMVDARNNLGNIYFQINDVQQALVEYMRVLQQDPNHLKAIENAAMAYQRLGQFDDEKEMWRRALPLETRPEWLKRIQERLSFNPSPTPIPDEARGLGIGR